MAVGTAAIGSSGPWVERSCEAAWSGWGVTEWLTQAPSSMVAATILSRAFAITASFNRPANRLANTDGSIISTETGPRCDHVYSPAKGQNRAKSHTFKSTGGRGRGPRPTVSGHSRPKNANG